MADALLAAAPVSDQSGNAYNGHTTSTVILAALFTASSMLGLLIYHCCKFLRDRAWRNYSGNEPSPNPALEEGNTNSGSFGSSFSSGSACGKEENKGLPDCAIDELPRIGILELARMKGGKDGLECCPVCLSEFDSGEEGTIRLLPACGHCFHACCIDLWLHSHASCPVCRHPLLADGNSSLLKPDSSAPVSGVDFHPITISDADDSEEKSDDDEEIDSDEEDLDAESG